MTGFNKRVYQMLSRIGVFGKTYPDLFVKGTVAGDLMDQIQAAVQKLSDHAASQVSGKGAVKRSVSNRARARKALQDQLEAIYRIARASRLTQFLIPRDRGDAVTVAVGKSFATNAEPIKQFFVDHHLPPDFIENLTLAVQELEAAIHEQTVSKGSRMSATKSIDEARVRALEAVQRLDAIMDNLLRHDPPTRTVWESSRHVERIGGAKQSETPAGAPA